MGALVLVLLVLNVGQLGSDARSYWRLDFGSLYANAVGNLSAAVAFRYAPPVAFALAPFGLLPLPVFLLAWLALAMAALAYLGRTWTLALVALYPVALELAVGNIHLLLAAALVAGLRWPAAWAVLPLTKVTPGVCWIWFAVRREWRSLGIAIAATVIVSAVTFVVAPGLWREWLAMLASDAGSTTTAGISVPVPLAIRLPLAVLVVAWGARTDRPWTLAVGLLLSLPTIWPQGFAVLAAVPALSRRAAAPAGSATAP